MRQWMTALAVCTGLLASTVAQTRTVEEFTIASFDGLELKATASLPDGPGPFAAVITLHGGQGDRSYTILRNLSAPDAVSATVRALNAEPWALFSFTYRNHAILGDEEKDVIAGIAAVMADPRVDAARVGVLGGSHGGHLALRAAQVMGDAFSCVAAGSPWLTDPHLFVEAALDGPQIGAFAESTRRHIAERRPYLRQLLARDQADENIDIATRLAERSIERNAHKIVIPALFITSHGDEIVPHAMVAPTIAGARAVPGADVRVYTADVAPHGFYWSRDSEDEKGDAVLAEEAAARDATLSFFRDCFSG